jgi:hypothetical protein
VRLFSVLLHRADEQAASGGIFELPFAFLLRLANLNRPTLQELRLYQQQRELKQEWPVARHATSNGAGGGQSFGMFFDLLAYGLDSASRFDVTGPQLCRILAAVGQTLHSQNETFRSANRSLADKFSVPGKEDVTEPASVVQKTPDQVSFSLDAPSEVEFRRDTEQGGSISLPGLTLWHASFIGPEAGSKLENQDATYAVRAPGKSAQFCIVFALADGISTSMGARVAANCIVRRFCEYVIAAIKPGLPVTADALIDAARHARASLDFLAQSLLHQTNTFVFDMVRGALPSRSAERILDNTLNPRLSAMPPALSSTLLGGVVQNLESSEQYRVDFFTIGDGVAEQIDSNGDIHPLVVTDPAVTRIFESVGPGPRAREVLEDADQRVGTHTVTLRAGETLLVSSDGLARGHSGEVSKKLADLLGEPFWITARSAEPDAALKILRSACSRADQIFENDPNESLFADNVSIIMIRCGGEEDGQESRPDA